MVSESGSTSSEASRWLAMATRAAPPSNMKPLSCKML